MRPLRVGIDTSALALTTAGTARHVRGLVDALAADPGIEVVSYRMPGSGRIRKLARDLAWYQAVLPRLAARDRIDVLHCPTPRAPTRSPVPLVLSVHDLAVLRHPRTFNAWTRRYTAATLPRLVREAAAVITVSSFSRDELTSLLAVGEDRVRVIPNGVDGTFVADGPASAGRYVLCVSTMEPRKNLTRTIQAFLASGLTDHELYLAGPPGWGDFTLPAHPRVRALGELTDEALAARYRGAACVVYASVYEGFGLPVLEAMACGAPVVASEGPPIEEFARDAFVSVDPLEPASIAAGLRTAIARRDALSARGLARAGAYTWSRVAALTAQVYRDVAARSGAGGSSG